GLKTTRSGSEDDAFRCVLSEALCNGSSGGVLKTTRSGSEDDAFRGLKTTRSGYEDEAFRAVIYGSEKALNAPSSLSRIKAVIYGSEKALNAPSSLSRIKADGASLPHFIISS
ncbi:hypothetical protein JOQ06_013923, partial [Pogonophryne albipinna]